MKFFNSTTLAMLLALALPLAGTAADTAPREPAAVGESATPAPAAPAGTEKVTAQPAQQLRIGYVDIARLRQESNKGKAISTQAKEKQKKFQSQLDTRRKQLEKQKANLEGKLASLTPAQREAKAREFQKKVEEFQNFGLKSEKELQELQEKLLDDLLKSIEAAATEYGTANGLGLVIVKRELLYLSGGVDAKDVTDGVLALLNRK